MMTLLGHAFDQSCEHEDQSCGVNFEKVLFNRHNEAFQKCHIKEEMSEADHKHGDAPRLIISNKTQSHPVASKH